MLCNARLSAQGCHQHLFISSRFVCFPARTSCFGDREAHLHWHLLCQFPPPAIKISRRRRARDPKLGIARTRTSYKEDTAPPFPVDLAGELRAVELGRTVASATPAAASCEPWRSERQATASCRRARDEPRASDSYRRGPCRVFLCRCAVSRRSRRPRRRGAQPPALDGEAVAIRGVKR